MAKTKQDIATMALRRLGHATVGQSPGGPVGAVAEEAVENAWHELRQQNTGYWLLDEVPEKVADAFAQFVASNLAGQLIQDPARQQFYLLQRDAALRRIYAVTANRDQSARPVQIVDY